MMPSLSRSSPCACVCGGSTLIARHLARPWSLVAAALGNGDGTFQAPQAYGFGDGPLAVAAGDFNRDGAPDLAVGHGDSITVLLGNGDGTFRMGPTFGVSNRPTSMAVGDFNGDGLADLAVAHYSSDSVSGRRG